jgi:hypothetical protein
MLYVGQTGRSFQTHFKEYKRDYQTNRKKSLYAKHLIKQEHTIYPMEKSMTILHHQRKGLKLNTIEQYHIYKATKTGKQLNEQYTDKHNAIFESILEIYPSTPPTSTINQPATSNPSQPHQ